MSVEKGAWEQLETYVHYRAVFIALVSSHTQLCCFSG